MPDGLNVSDFVRVDVTLEPAAAQTRNFGAGLIVTDRSVIDPGERIRAYTQLDAVLQEFGTNGDVSRAATLHFSQRPQPQILYIGRWVRNASRGLLKGATLSASQRVITNFNAISNGSLHIALDGTEYDVTGINLTGVLNLNAVADILQTALAAKRSGTTVAYDGVYNRFRIVGQTSGPSGSVSYATPVSPATGTDLATRLHLTAADASPPVPGASAESLTSCIANLADLTADWYSVQVAVSESPADADLIAAASTVEGLGNARIFGATITNAGALDPTFTTDFGSLAKSLGLARTYAQFSSTDANAANSLFGRAATVDFAGSNTTITLAYKQEPGVVPELLRESQKAALDAKNINYFARVQNGTAIIFPGKMANGDYFDERHGLDWFQNELQTALYNLLYTTPTKVPQTDGGMDLIKAVIKATCLKAVNNGLAAPGLWTGPSFGALKTGDPLSSGFYIYAPPVATQNEADRAARKSVSFQVALKLAGAVHFIISAVLVDR